MEYLISALDSFQPGWREKGYVEQFISIAKEIIIPSYPFLDARIENNKALFAKEWDQIVAALKEAHVFELFSPPEYGGKEASEQELYLMMELMGFASPGLGIPFLIRRKKVSIVTYLWVVHLLKMPEASPRQVWNL